MNIREDLKAYVDGELAPERANEIEAAIASDPGLRQEVEFMRVLGFEIKRLAAEPEVVGRERAIGAVKRKPFEWWHPYSPIGRLAIAGGFALILGAIFFPVFAQSKASAKKTSAIAWEKQQRMGELGGAAASTPNADTWSSPADSGGKGDYNGAISGQFAHTQGVPPQEPMVDGDVSSIRGRAGFGADNGGPAMKPETQDGLNLQSQRATGGGGGGSSAAGEGEVAKSRVARPMYSDSTLPGSVAEKAPFDAGRGMKGTKKSSNAPAHTKDKLQPNDTGKSILPQASNRMVIQNADMTVRVDDVTKSVENARSMARTLGGFVENSHTEGAASGTPTGIVTMRVPSNRFDDAVKQLSDYGEVVGGAPNISGEDVTKQYADMTGRVRVLHAEEDSYVTMLRGAKKIGEILEIKDRLSQVRQEIQSLEEQRIAVKDQSMMSTITARFEQKPKAGEQTEKPKDWSGEAWANAVNGLQAAGRFVGQLVIFLFVYTPIWLPPVVLFWWLGKKAKMGRGA